MVRPMMDWAPKREMCLSDTGSACSPCQRCVFGLDEKAGMIKRTGQLDRDVAGAVGLDVSYLLNLRPNSDSVEMIQNGTGSSPRSPTCLSSESGPPWFLPLGLKWDPAETQPLLIVRARPQLWHKVCTKIGEESSRVVSELADGQLDTCWKPMVDSLDVEAPLGVGVEVLDLSRSALLSLSPAAGPR